MSEKPRPYKGPRPYEEQDQDNFFGRESDKRILIDKILTHKLTFLFAASGVGKSSLLQAAVMPELKNSPDRAGLDVIYYRDWASTPSTPVDPLVSLKTAVQNYLRENQQISTDYALDDTGTLDQFLQMCTTFTSEPLIIILDQFEEFFNYQRHSKYFTPFVQQLAVAIHDRTTATTFVIAMREDFALELNAFKQHIPLLLIDNFYRLEKLTPDKAKLAIVAPVEKLGFQYEADLLATLLKELSQREQLERYGLEFIERFHGELPLWVEPPHLQIICEQLWDAEWDNPQKLLTFAVYERKGRAKGLLENYFADKIAEFSQQERQLASLAFNYLVNRHGTKMAYPVQDLAQLLRVDEQALLAVLEKLDGARVLHKQSRQDKVWFELYHDVFAKTVFVWNEEFKRKQRRNRAIWTGLAVVVAGVALVAGYDGWQNYAHYHWRLSVKRGVSENVEVYRGQYGSQDWFGLQRYVAESGYTFKQIEPSRLFEVKAITGVESAPVELVRETFPTAG
ncbi:MAG: hypothetical protein BWK79_17710, partial [Beggiatoa sp. IS2]